MRKSWDQYFMDIAAQVATRATCSRKHVGAVLVKDKHILATGYNGSLPGQPHCDDVGHLMEDGHCIRTNHAEANAICQAARRGTSTEGSTAYVTASPCYKCFQLLVSAGISRIVFGELYRDERITQLAADSRVLLSLVPVSSIPQPTSTEAYTYRWLAASEAAEQLGVHPSTIYKWGKQGRLAKRYFNGSYEFFVRVK